MIQPFEHACWLWPQPIDHQPANEYAQFRTDFNLAVQPREAPFSITADQMYVLYVNGRYVCRGPARGYQHSWPYDEIDLAEYLVKGANWISVLAYNPGVSTFQYRHQDNGGMICSGRFDSTRIDSSEQWLCRLAPGQNQLTTKLSVQQNFQEWFDKRQADQSWIASPEISDQGWARPAMARSAGAMPWPGHEPRNIPHLTKTILDYKCVVAIGSGACAPGWETARNLFKPVHAEVTSTTWTKPQGLDPVCVEIAAAGEGRFQAVTLDMARPTCGTLIVDIDGAADGDVVDFFFAEASEKNDRPLVGESLTTGCSAAFVNRLVLKAGRNTHEFFQMIGHRTLTIFARGTTGQLTVKPRVRETIYPMEISGAFESDNETLNHIHRICTQTQRVCMLDAYVDTPWREQAQWWGDARVQASNTFHLCCDDRLLKRGIRSLAGQRVPNGLTYGHAPTRAHHCVLPDFSLVWIITIWDHYFQTGSTELYTEQLERIHDVLGYFTTVGEGVAENGLLRYDSRYWLFLDWCDIEKEDYPALFNMWYLYTLQKLAEMAQASGDQGNLRHFTELAAKQSELIIEHYWDAEQSLFRDATYADGRKSTRYSIQTQALAILCGLQSDFHQVMIAKRLLPVIKGEDVDSARPSSYWITYVYEALTKFGLAADVIESIIENWTPMIPSEGCWESFGTNGKFAFGGASQSHAWAAHPISHMAKIIGGIVQLAPGWRKIAYRPHPGLAGTSRASVTVPTPFGNITSQWQMRDDGTCEKQFDCPAEIEVVRG
jgi:hypothetical protein